MLATINFLALIYLNFYTVYGFDFPTICGRSKASAVDSDLRIVGGTETFSGEFPWQIILTREFTNELGQKTVNLCGGTIISPSWMLTAAHCVADATNLDEFTVRLGEHDINIQEGTELLASVKEIYYNKEFSKETVSNDIALVKIKGVIDFADKHSFLEPVCIATPTTVLTTNCVATGFGYKNVNGAQADVLQKVKEPITDDYHCSQEYKDYNPQQNVCAGGSSSGGMGTCGGDSGGPLQCQATDGRWFQVGITSYGIPCALANTPDVFTKVSAYNDWIKSVIDEFG